MKFNHKSENLNESCGLDADFDSFGEYQEILSKVQLGDGISTIIEQLENTAYTDKRARRVLFIGFVMTIFENKDNELIKQEAVELLARESAAAEKKNMTMTSTIQDGKLVIEIIKGNENSTMFLHYDEINKLRRFIRFTKK